MDDTGKHYTYQGQTLEALLMAVAQDGQPYLAELLSRLFSELRETRDMIRGLVG